MAKRELYFDEIKAGDKGISPSYTFTEERINAYAELTGAFSATNAARLVVGFSGGTAIAIVRGVFGMNGDWAQGFGATGLGYFNGSSDAAIVTWQNGGGVQTLSSLSYINIHYLGK